MKYKDHHMRHRRGHLAIKQVPKGLVVAHGATNQFGRGQNTLLGWSDPTLARDSRAQSESWVAPAQFLSVRAMRIWTKQVKKVGITYFSFVFTIFFSL